MLSLTASEQGDELRSLIAGEIRRRVTAVRSPLSPIAAASARTIADDFEAFGAPLAFEPAGSGDEMRQALRELVRRRFVRVVAWQGERSVILAPAFSMAKARRHGRATDAHRSARQESEEGAA